MSTRRGGIPGPESRTGLTRPAMSEAEFERRLNTSTQASAENGPNLVTDPSSSSGAMSATLATGEPDVAVATRVNGSSPSTRSRTPRVKASKPRRVQRMFAVEEDLDKKLWLYAIHLGKDRSEVVNDLLRPVVASMVLYDSRDRRSATTRNAELDLAENRDLADVG
jgi:hypothetical protein